MKRTLALLVALAGFAASAEPLKRIHVTTDRAPDCSSLKSIVESVTRDCKTDDEKAIAIYHFCRYACYHHAYPNEKGGISALKLINVYGWGLCGGLHTVQSALWEAAGYKWRYRGWSRPGHTTTEVRYGDRWHYLDTFLKFYTWAPDPRTPSGRTIASQEDILANSALVEKGFVMDDARSVCYHTDNRFEHVADKANWTAPAFMVCGDTLTGVLTGVRNSRNSGSPRGWGGIKFDDPDYDMDVDLRPGFSLTLDWNRQEGAHYFSGKPKAPRHTCGDKDFRNCPVIGPILEPYHALNRSRSWSNGTLVCKPDLSTKACLQTFESTQNVMWSDGVLRPETPGKPAVLVVHMVSPYVVAKSAGEVDCADARTELSLDGTTWKPADLANLTPAVAGKFGFRVRISFAQPFRGIELTSVVQHNQEALPYLAPGDNTVTVTAANSATLGDNRLAVTFAYCLGARSRTPEQVLDRGAEIARAHYATWSDKPIVVRQIVDRLPCELRIPVPTPKGKQPVYPRMVFLRREVLTPGQEPMPVPVTPTTPAVGQDETLAALPTPWTMGATPPERPPPRPTDTRVVPIARQSYVSKDGKTYGHQFIKWLKDNSNAWVLLLDVDRAQLPKVDEFAGAKLVFHVHESHNRAPMKAAVSAISAPFKAGKPFDFSKIGDIVGWTIVERGNGPGDPFVPPKRYEIDVSREIRRWLRDEPGHGLALRIVPSRPVDDGWTVRFTPAKAKPAELEVSVYKPE